jgi:hypothetical protein
VAAELAAEVGSDGTNAVASKVASASRPANLWLAREADIGCARAAVSMIMLEYR